VIKHLQFSVQASISGILVCLLVACSASDLTIPSRLPDSTRTPPVYPSATQVVVTPYSDVLTDNMQLSFVTSDKTSDILAYYKDVLTRENWEFDGHVPAPHNYYSFSWKGNVKDPVFGMQLVIDENNPTTVKVTLLQHVGR